MNPNALYAHFKRVKVVRQSKQIRLKEVLCFNSPWTTKFAKHVATKLTKKVDKNR